jgi:hypothetical protein
VIWRTTVFVALLSWSDRGEGHIPTVVKRMFTRPVPYSKITSSKFQAGGEIVSTVSSNRKRRNLPTGYQVSLLKKGGKSFKILLITCQKIVDERTWSCWDGPTEDKATYALRARNIGPKMVKIVR